MVAQIEEIIDIPYGYTPRDYQLPFLRAMDDGCKRAVKLWHRRAGKDKTDLNLTIKRMFRESPGGRIGTYFHIFPTYTQGKKIIWDGIDGEGFKVMKHFPAPYVVNLNETELQVTLENGSIYQIIGADNPDSVRGTNPVGVIYSEFSVQDPEVSNILEPILAENGGWAVYNFTPIGHNHAKTLYDMALENPDWFCEKLTILDTKRSDGSPVIPMSEIEKLRREGKREDFIQQEFFCSFSGFQEGTIYGKQLLSAESDGRITEVPYDPRWPVFTWWDLGVNNSTAIWFAQRVGARINIIDYYESSGEGIPYYAKYLKNEVPYVYAQHYWPHDGRNRDFGMGEVRQDLGESLGIRPIDIIARGVIEDGIEMVRALLPRCYFDRRKTQKGRDALTTYSYEIDQYRSDDTHVSYKSKPKHDWTSNSADAFRTGAMSDFERVSIGTRGPIHVQSSFDPANIRDYDTEVESDFDPSRMVH